MKLPVSDGLNQRLHAAVPGGAHTYAKADDQYPEGLAPIISRGHGGHVWDVDGNEYIEFGAGLRAVALGHAHPRVVEAVLRELDRGGNIAWPSAIEVDTAERFLQTVPTAKMVMFARTGSEVTTAAVRAARAATDRPVVAVCGDQPFFSIDDWFIATTPMAAGTLPQRTVTFPYGDLDALEGLFAQHSGEIACVILEPATHNEPPPGYLDGVRALTKRHGAVLVFDETITGFRWSESGAQGVYGITPDLSTFGKALGNGFAISALAGRRELMELAVTHSAEPHALAAANAVMEVYRTEGSTERLHTLGRRLATGVSEAAAAMGVADHVLVRGRASNLVFATLDQNGRPSQEYRTLFLRQLLCGGVIGPSLVVSTALTEEDIDRTIDAVGQACAVYRKALDAGDPTPWMGGRPVKPAIRAYA